MVDRDMVLQQTSASSPIRVKQPLHRFTGGWLKKSPWKAYLMLCLMLLSSVTPVFADGNLINSGAIDNSGTVWIKNEAIGLEAVNGGTYKFSGTDQTIPGRQYTHLFLSGSGTKTADSAVAVSGTLAIDNAVVFATGTSVVTLSGTLSENGYLLGKIQKTDTLTREDGGTSHFGNVGVSITWDAHPPGITTVKRTTGTALTSSATEKSSIKRYVDISSVVNTGLDATLEFYYNDNELNGHNESTLALWRSADSGATWRYQGEIDLNTTINRVTKTGIPSFGRFTLSDADNPLGPMSAEGVATTLAQFSGNNQSATVATVLEQPLTVLVTDAYDNPVANTEVTFSISGTPSGAASQHLSDTVVQTNAEGKASTVLTLGTKTGTYTVTAASAGLTGSPLSFTATATAGLINNFLVESAGGGEIPAQTASTPFDIKITARDVYSNIATSFSGTVDVSSTGTLSAGSGTTLNFENGVLTSHTVAISTLGTYTITATKTGSSESGTSNSFAVNPGIKTWDGGAFTNNWGDAENWSPDGVPLSTDNVNLVVNEEAPLNIAGKSIVVQKQKSGKTLAADEVSVVESRNPAKGRSLVSSSAQTESATPVTIDINVNAVARNVTLNNSDLTLTVQSGKSLSLSGDLTVINGTLNTEAAFPSVAGTTSITGGTVGYTSGGTQTVAGNVYHNLILGGDGVKTFGNNVTVNGTLSLQGTASVSLNDHTLTYSSGSTLEYKGSGTQTTGAELPAIMSGSVIVDNAGGVVLSRSTVVGSGLTLVNGKMITEDYHLTASSISGYSSSKYIVATGNGEVRRTVSATGAVTLPIGDSANYTPATVTIVSASEFSNAYISGRVTPVKHPENNSTNYLTRYWTLNASGITFPSYSLTLQYSAGDVVGTESNIYSALYVGPAWPLFSPANTSTHQLTASGLSSLGVFSGADEDAALPVELVSFTAVPKKRSVELTWKTATEVNNYGFEIERGGDTTKSKSVSWKKVGFVEGHGTTNAPQEYSFTDRNVGGKVQYRLKQIDRDGKFTYTSPIEVTVALAPEDYHLSQNYPNPFNPHTNISFAVRNAEHVWVKVYNMLGQEVTTLFNDVANPDELYVLTFDGRNFASGTYIYVLKTADRYEVKKMLMVK